MLPRRAERLGSPDLGLVEALSSFTGHLLFSALHKEFQSNEGCVETQARHSLWTLSSKSPNCLCSGSMSQMVEEVFSREPYLTHVTDKVN